jgi:hypothetical protein
MNKVWFWIAGGAALLVSLAALDCARAGEAAPAAQGSGLPFQELPTQTLGKGQCALFLWSRTTPPQRVFMSLQDPAVARVRIGGKSVDLPRTAWDGESAFGHYQRQSYAGSGLALDVTIQMDARSGLVGGAVVPTGSIEYRDAAGWQTVIPVAGMIGCQP